MKRHTLILAATVLAFAAACQSEIDNQPAAEVTQTVAGSATATTATAATSTAPTPGAVTSNVIKEKSSIEWVGAKVTRDHDGKFNDFNGWIEYAGGQPSRIAFEIDMNSIESDDPKLTGHLKSADFFDVAKFPKATFVSTSITPAAAGAAGGATHTVKGQLNMHGVEREVTIPVRAQVSAEGVRTTSEFTINRHDWGISYRGAADDLIRDNVLIRLNLMFPPPPAA